MLPNAIRRYELRSTASYWRRENESLAPSRQGRTTETAKSVKAGDAKPRRYRADVMRHAGRAAERPSEARTWFGAHWLVQLRS